MMHLIKNELTIKTFEIYWELLKDGGVFIIEDLLPNNISDGLHFKILESSTAFIELISLLFLIHLSKRINA